MPLPPGIPPSRVHGDRNVTQKALQLPVWPGGEIISSSRPPATPPPEYRTAVRAPRKREDIGSPVPAPIEGVHAPDRSIVDEADVEIALS